MMMSVGNYSTMCCLTTSKGQELIRCSGKHGALLRLPNCGVGRIAEEELVIGIDVGTSGTKVALLSSHGTLASSAFSPHPPPTPSIQGAKHSSEQDQNTWWLATKLALRDCLLSASHTINFSCIKAIAVTGQMQDVILLPKDGVALTQKAILYSDARAVEEANEMIDFMGGQSFLYSITGNSQGATSLLAKLRWLDKYDGMAVHKCKKILFGGHDYITWKLSKAYVTDPTTASTTGLVDCSFEYAVSLLRELKLDHWIDKLPFISACDRPCGEVSKTAAEELDMVKLHGVPVFHCCGDSGACTLGAGAGIPGASYAYLGTSGWIAGSFLREQILTKRKCPLPGVFTLAHPDSSFILRTGSIMNAGGNLSWAASKLNMNLKDTIGSTLMEEVDMVASSSPVGSNGLLYLPFLSGERCPFEDSDARAAFIGISASTTVSDMFRSVMEGVCFALRSARDAMDVSPDTGLHPLFLVGGGARSPIWPAILADVFQQTVHVLEDPQNVAVKGAAMLAGNWLGWHSSYPPDGDWIKVSRSFDPIVVNMERYNELYAVYNNTCLCLMNTFKQLAKYRHES